MNPHQTTFRLEYFNGKTYEPADVPAMTVADALRPSVYPSRAWRIVATHKDRPARPRYTAPRGSTAGSKSQGETVRAYLDWCIAHGVAPTFYKGSRYVCNWGSRPCKVVPVSDFLGDAPANEWQEGDAE